MKKDNWNQNKSVLEYHVLRKELIMEDVRKVTLEELKNKYELEKNKLWNSIWRI